MAQFLYASFLDASNAEKAIGALMDHGVPADDITLVSNEKYATRKGRFQDKEKQPGESAKTGITTTTPADAGVGAAKGAGVGAVLGILAGIASLAIPGFGLVTGGGALATAIGTALGTAAGGAVAGGVAGFLKDQGIPEQVAMDYQNTIIHGGAMLSVPSPCGDMSQPEVERLLAKYGAQHLGVYGAVHMPH